MKSKHHIYFDYAAATPLDPKVAEAMKPYWSDDFANAGSLHTPGKKAQQALTSSRHKIAKVLNCNPDEIYFTGGGTESITMAIQGVAQIRHPKSEIITSAIEHAAVLENVSVLKNWGRQISIIAPDGKGIIKAQNILQAIKPQTTLISLMLANNEIGTIQPVVEIGKALRTINKQRATKNLNPVLLHTDACQAGNYLSLNIQKLHVDLLSLSGCKLYGPKGTGLLYVRRGLKLQPIIHGGGQERGLKSGTENIPGIVGLAKALERSQSLAAAESKRLTALRNYFWQGIQKIYAQAHLNGDLNNRLPNNLNISFPGFEGETLLYKLDKAGIAVSTGSACSETSQEPSHVLRAIGLSAKLTTSSLRFSLGRQTVKTDIITALRIVKAILQT
jgi:cysteine desulfurase